MIGLVTPGNAKCNCFTLPTSSRVDRGTKVFVRRMLSSGSEERVSKRENVLLSLTAPPKQLVVLSKPEGSP